MQLRLAWQKLDRFQKLALGSLCFYALLQLLAPFYVAIDGHDSMSHLRWIAAFGDLLHQGILYPRWLPNSFAGFGAPIFYFYPPANYYLGGLISSIVPTLSAAVIYHTIGILASLVSFAGCYLFLKRCAFSIQSSFIGSLLYAAAPYRFLDLYIRNALGEHSAFAIIPFLFLAVEGILDPRDSTAGAFVGLALLWALLILTNLPIASVIGILLPVYIIARSFKSGSRPIVLIVMAGVLGTCCAMFYLLPIAEFYHLLYSQELGAAAIRTKSSGSALFDLFSGKNLAVNLYCTITLFAAFLLLPLRSNALADRGDARSRFIAFRSVILLSLLLQVPFLTLPLFQHVPPFTIVQFSWRADVILLFATAYLAAILWERRGSFFLPALLVSWSAIGSLFLVLTAAHVQVHPHPLPGAFDPREYLPAGASLRITDSLLQSHARDPIIETNDSGIRIQSYRHSATMRRIEADVPHESQATFHHFYWPQWKIRVNGQTTKSHADSLRRLVCELPPGRDTIRLQLTESNAESTGILLSTVGVALVLGLCGVLRLRKKRNLSQS